MAQSSSRFLSGNSSGLSPALQLPAGWSWPGEKRTKKGVKEQNGKGAAGEAVKCPSGAGSTKCGVMVGSNPIPPFLESSRLLTLIMVCSEGLPLLRFLINTNMEGISFPAQLCQDLLSCIPGQAAATLPSKGLLHLPPNMSTFKVLQHTTSTAFPCSKRGVTQVLGGLVHPPGTGRVPHLG